MDGKSETGGRFVISNPHKDSPLEKRQIRWLMIKLAGRERIMKTKKHRTSPVLGLGLAFCVGTSSVLCVLPVHAQEQEPVAVEVTNGPTIYATDGEPLQVNTAPAKAGSADSNVPASEDTAVSTVYSTDSQSSAISEAQTAALSSNTSSGSVTVTIEEKAIVSTEDAVPSTESASVKNSSQEGNPGIAPSDDQSAANNLSEYTNCEASSESEDFLRPELETVPVPEQSLGESISSELSFADPSGEVLSQSNPVSDNSSTLAAKSVASTSAPEVKRALRIQAQPKNISTGVMASDSTELSTEEAASSVSISYIDLSKSEDQEIFSKLFKTTTTDIEVPNRYSASMTNTSMPDYSVSKCNSDLILETDTQTAAKTYIPIISITRSEQFVTKAQLDDFTESTSTTVYREARESYPQTWTLMQDVTYTTIDGKVYSGKIYKRWRTTYSYEKSEDSSKRIVYGWSTVEKTEVPVYTVRTTYTCRVDMSTITTLRAGATVPVETQIRTEVPAIEGGYTLTNYSEFFTYMSGEGVLGVPKPYRLAYTRASSSTRYYEEPEVIAVAIPRNATLIRTQATYYTTTASNNSVVLRGSLTDTYCWSKRDDAEVGDMITTTTVDHTVLSAQLCTLYWDADSELIDGTLSVYIPRYTVAPKMLYTVSYTILTTDITTTVYVDVRSTNIQTTDFDLTYDWPDKAQVYLGFDVDYNYSLTETYALTPHPNYVEKNHYFLEHDYFLEHVGEVKAYTTVEYYNTAFIGFFVPTIACDFVANTTGYRYFLPYSVTRTESAGLVRYFRTYYYSPVYMDETTITWETIPSMSTTTSAPAASTFTPASETITTPDSTVTTIFTILKTSIPIQSESGEVSGAMRTPLLQETTTVSAAAEILQPTQTKSGMVLGAMRTSPMAMGTPSRDAKTGDSPMLFWYLIGVLSGTAVLSAWLINEKRRSR